MDDVVLAEAPAISGTLPNATDMLLGKKQNSSDGLAPPASEEKDLCRGRDKRPSWVQQWCDRILRRQPQNPSDSNTSKEDPQQPGASMAPVPPRLQPETIQDDLAPGFGPRLFGKVRTTSAKITSLKTTNELGYKNLAELYARYGDVEEPRQESGLENIETSAVTHSSAGSARNQAPDDMDEM